jgi:hypothetical protein
MFDNNTYTASLVYNANSTLVQLQTALTNLTISENADLDYARQFLPSLVKFKQNILGATTDEEVAYIKLTYESKVTAYENLISTISKKYADRDRLTQLIASKTSRITGPSTLQTSADPTSTTPSPESVYIPTIL